jgi:hypothetical protein
MRRTILTAREAADYLRLHPVTLAKMRVTGVHGPSFLKLGSKVVYDQSDLDAWLDSRRRRSTSDGASEAPKAA